MSLIRGNGGIDKMLEIRSRILGVLSKQLSVTTDEILDDDGPGDFQKWDSFGQLEIITELEKEFSIQFSIDDIMTIENVGDIVDKVNRILE
jgi:acyl carrier protein